jgi:hypothetical protein
MRTTLVVCSATLLQIARHRIALLLFFVMPPLLLSVVVLTSRDDESFGFTLPALGGTPTLFASPREITLLFVAIAACGLFTGFAALAVMQENAASDRRLTLTGLHPVGLIAGRALAVVVVSSAAGLFVGALTLPFLPSARFGPVLLSLVVGGIVYGTFGLAVGVVLRGPLEGVLVTALLVQLDAGWLQNPVYYADAARTALLHALPAYWPSQAALAGAFGGPDPRAPVALALAYGAVLFALATVVFVARAPRPRELAAPPPTL